MREQFATDHYPTTTPHRDGLTGQTITVERLTHDHAERLHRNPNLEGRLCLTSRKDGHFRCSFAVFTTDFAPAAEAAARVAADHLNAAYIPGDVTALARTAAARHPLETLVGEWLELHLDGGTTVSGHTLNPRAGYIDVRSPVDGSTRTIRMDTVTRWTNPA